MSALRFLCLVHHISYLTSHISYVIPHISYLMSHNFF